MIITLIGTRAQLIKMAPVMREMERRALPYIFILSGQHKNTLTELITDFGITTTPLYLYEGTEIDSIHKVPFWYLLCIINFLKFRRKKLFALENSGNVMLVHGDTFSTLLGATIARIIKAKLVHIEAGLRSFNIFHPFPEELNRITTFHLSDLSFCPGDFACKNMENYKTRIINTHHNTLLDATRLALAKVSDADTEKYNYCVCSIHRFENIFFRKRLVHIASLLESVARQIRIKFVMHPATKKRLEKYKLYEKLSKNDSIELVDRMRYTDFIRLLHYSSFVITDGGSNQEELYYMGKPTLLMRKHTERTEGLSSTAVLSAYDAAKINSFIHEAGNYRQNNPLISGSLFPSSIIVDHLQTFR